MTDFKRNQFIGSSFLSIFKWLP